ncbi:hypothetical protein EXIGLDRAFT_436128 [Exidia glandulosa HHB12029]|uniref:Uncharacterized protein n=1 Tax=Exidia glandulosa HHB12029 TaxID=1314781 RepID=A0A165B8Y6_EXIGL|nr:hypothetical protein EXIGLDRAFT_436128 [Exidia glandulosa HHB12029]
MKKDIGGGLILRVKQPALKRFGLDENTNMIVVIFDKPQPGSAEWNDMKRGKFIQFVHRWQSKSGQVSAETLHAIVNQARAMVDADADLALDLEGEEDEESRRRTVLEQAMIYKDIKIRNSNSNGGSGSATRKRKSVGEEKTLVHYFAKGKGKEVEEEEEIRAVPAKDFYERVQERQASRPRLSRPSSERDELDFLGNDERERARQKQLKEERARAYDRGEAEKGRRMSTRRLKALEQEEEEEEEVKTVAVARKDKEPVKNPDEMYVPSPLVGKAVVLT